MAISKEQALRPYVQALGNAFADMDSLPEQVDELTRSMDQVEQSLTDTVNPFVDRFRFGMTEEITVEAGISYSGPVTYDVPFDENARYILLIDFADGTMPTNLSVSIVESEYSGFRYTVHNAGENDVTVRLVYMGVRVG